MFSKEVYSGPAAGSNVISPHSDHNPAVASLHEPQAELTTTGVLSASHSGINEDFQVEARRLCLMLLGEEDEVEFLHGEVARLNAKVERLARVQLMGEHHRGHACRKLEEQIEVLQAEMEQLDEQNWSDHCETSKLLDRLMAEAAPHLEEKEKEVKTLKAENVWVQQALKITRAEFESYKSMYTYTTKDMDECVRGWEAEVDALNHRIDVLTELSQEARARGRFSGGLIDPQCSTSRHYFRNHRRR